MHDVSDDRRGAPAIECPASGKHLVEHDAEREDVGAFVGRPPFELFGRHVLHRAENRPGVRQRLRRSASSRHWRPAGCRRLARPKSSSLTPLDVSMMLPGFRSRWTMPARCAAASASAICRVGQRLAERQLAAPQPRGQRLAIEVFHHQEVDAILVTDVEQRTDVGMRQRRDRARLAIEALARRRVRDQIV